MGDENIFVITNGSAQINQLSSSASVDFANSGSGTSMVYHLSYSGSLSGLEEGSSIEDIMGCFDFSNSISITKLTGDDCPSNCVTDAGMMSEKRSIWRW